MTNEDVKNKTKLYPNDFQITSLLGEGNFSKIYQVIYKRNKKPFAMKVIEKTDIERTKRRHPNILNEIMMEKRALNKLCHPNVVTLYGTFQDEGTLYFVMELLDEELWCKIHEKSVELKSSAAVGCYWTEAIFYFAEILNALEYMHRRGIVHRDLKPENLMVTSDGHIKILDLGTAKDLEETDLNGPNFVGTPEYMSPTTVDSKESGVEGDLWALGVLLFQLLLGYSPFFTPSPYLTFLRIKKSLLKIPDVSSEPLESMLHILLERDDKTRLRNALIGKVVVEHSCMTNTDTTISSWQSPQSHKDINYDRLRAHALFDCLASCGYCNCPIEHRPEPTEGEFASVGVAVDFRTDEDTPNGNVDASSLTTRQKANVNKLRSLHEFRSHSSHCWACISAAVTDSVQPSGGGAASRIRPVPKLSEYCIRAVGVACTRVAEATAFAGGIRPKIGWMERFDLSRLDAHSRALVAHYLRRHNHLHSAAVFRLFWPSVVDARSHRADFCTKEYLGHTHNLHGHWEAPFFFAAIGGPCFGQGRLVEQPLSADEAVALCEPQQGAFRSVIGAVNKLRPRFLVVIGSFTSPQQVKQASCAEAKDALLSTFRRSMARVSDTIPVIYVPGSGDIDTSSSSVVSALVRYRKHFGADYFGFWYRGLRCLVINSPLMADPSSCEEEAALQDSWFDEEIEQAKLCGTAVMVFSYHSWHPCACKSDGSGSSCVKMPADVVSKWLKRLRNPKVKFIFSVSTCPSVSRGSDCDRGVMAFARGVMGGRRGGEEATTQRMFESGDTIATSGGTEDNHVLEEDNPPMIEEGSDQETVSEGEEEFENADTSYEGPLLTSIQPVSALCETSTSDAKAVVCVVEVFEESSRHKNYSLHMLPSHAQLCKE